MGFLDKFRKKKSKKKPKKQQSQNSDYFVESNKDGNLF